jgi:hypothetical protein
MTTRYPPSSKRTLAAARREQEIAAAMALVAVLDPEGRRSNQALISAALDAVLGALGQRRRAETPPPRSPKSPAKSPANSTAKSPAKSTAKTTRCHDLGLTLVAPWRLPVEELPACSRRIHLKAGPRMTLRHLHDAIQAAFAWQDRHLAAFCDAPGAKRVLAQRVVDEFADDEDDAPLFEQVTLDDVLTPGRVLFYTYDFGDEWWVRIDHHGLVDEAAQTKQLLIDAVGIAPPEDCGGVGGFARLCEAWNRDQQGLQLDDDEAELLAWAGPDFTVEFDTVAREGLRRSFDRPRRRP